MNTRHLQERICKQFTDDILLAILRKKTGCKYVTIRDIKFGPRTKKGDSYLSTVTKFTVTGIGEEEGSGDKKEFEEHIIVKSVPKNVARKKTFRSIDFFTNEIAFYTKVWPILNKFQQSKKVKNPFESIPQCLYTYSNGTSDFIVLEDVSFQGYCDLGRASGFDFDQAKLIIAVFARFHSLSLAFKDQHPKEFEDMASNIQETYYAAKFRRWSKENIKNLYTVAHDAVEKELPKSYLKKINEYLPDDLFQKASEICASHGKLAVIAHGDCWVPNLLVKFNEDGTTPVDCVMIDFQLARYSSLSTDILFFLLSCLKPATMKHHWDDLLNTYHEVFVEFLKDLGSSESLLTFEALNEDLKRHGEFGFISSLENIVMSQLDDDEVTDIDMIQGDEEVALDTIWIIRPLKNEEKRKKVAEFFRYLVDNNFI